MAKRKQIKSKVSSVGLSRRIEKLDAQIMAINKEINRIDEATGGFGTPQFKNNLLKLKKANLKKRLRLRNRRLNLLRM